MVYGLLGKVNNTVVSDFKVYSMSYCAHNFKVT